jgi:hypothetical protein
MVVKNKLHSFFVGIIKLDMGSNNLKSDKCQESKATRFLRMTGRMIRFRAAIKGRVGAM